MISPGMLRDLARNYFKHQLMCFVYKEKVILRGKNASVQGRSECDDAAVVMSSWYVIISSSELSCAVEQHECIKKILFKYQLNSANL
jgi:hypothetical protein